MPNIKQTIAAEETIRALADRKAVLKKDILKKAGYSETVQNAPSRIFDSVGFKKALQELTEHLMIDKESRMFRLAEIFWKGKPNEALKANAEISKMQGDYLPIQADVRDFRTDRDNLIKPE